MKLDNKVFRKIPIVISPHDDGETKGWRAEIADGYNDWETTHFKDINFEDIGFHFNHEEEVNYDDQYVFCTRNGATKASKLVRDVWLCGNAKIWYIS